MEGPKATPLRLAGRARGDLPDEFQVLGVWLEGARLWLILDGLDEMAGEVRKEFLSQLYDYLNEGGDGARAPVVLSSRPAGEPYKEILQEYKRDPDWKLPLFHIQCV